MKSEILHSATFEEAGLTIESVTSKLQAVIMTLEEDRVSCVQYYEGLLEEKKHELSLKNAQISRLQCQIKCQDKLSRMLHADNEKLEQTNQANKQKIEQLKSIIVLGSEFLSKMEDEDKSLSKTKRANESRHHRTTHLLESRTPRSKKPKNKLYDAHRQYESQICNTFSCKNLDLKPIHGRNRDSLGADLSHQLTPKTPKQSLDVSQKSQNAENDPKTAVTTSLLINDDRCRALSKLHYLRRRKEQTDKLLHNEVVKKGKSKSRSSSYWKNLIKCVNEANGKRKISMYQPKYIVRV